MNVKAIMQIINDLESIADQQLQFGGLYSSACRLGGRKRKFFSPLGHHINQHPELKELLGVELRVDEYPYTPTISEMCNTNQKTFTTRREWWSIDEIKLQWYLGLNHEHTQCLLYNSRFTKHEFINTVTRFVKGELDIRECRRDYCGTVYITSLDDQACVCEDCKEDMLDMCGM